MVKLVLVLALVAASGCYKHTITVGQGGNMGKQPIEQRDYFFIDGAVGQSTTNVEQICKGPNATVVVQETLIDGVIGNCLCDRLLMPQTTQIYCGEQSSGGGTSAPPAPLGGSY